MRIGVFGGSFDPIHFGHLWIAEAACEILSLSEIRWVPAAQSPLKPGGPIASGGQRLNMLRLALAGLEGHVIDERELHRSGVSYTVDTITEMRNELPNAEWLMILGSDSLSTIRDWHRPQSLLEMAIPAVVQRGGEPDADFSILSGLVSDERIEQFRRHVIPMPLIEVSSRQLRQRVAKGKSIRFRTPRAVEAFIDAEKLYVA